MTALTVFRTVVELGSFAAAARKLNLSPAAISKNVSELEGHLSARLINRTTRRMSLTEAGTLYFERVAQVLDDLREADATLQAIQDTPSGVLRVSAPVTVTLIGLSEKIPKFLARYPDLTLDLRLNDRRVNLVEEGFDVALRGSDNLEDSGLIARKLMIMDHVVCAAPSYFEQHGCPTRPEDLALHNCVKFTLSDHAVQWTFRQGRRTVKVPVRGRYKVSSSLAVRDALRAGFGLSLVPRMYVAEDLAAGRLRPALEDWTPNETGLYAVYPSRRYVMSKVRVFLDFLVEELQG
ncbi:LysR family transcriptional regulator [Ruegeria arenilitoris]|uniref:LysR family transcriptional regulator n=1 Tax=Ruegeria arenilitoris TaxID=1173585 RepID=UPI001C2CA4FD|nr:LysR family transcriptional regulator [Ruegeria arenilitoris]